MRETRSLKNGWCTFQDAIKAFKTTKARMTNWKQKYPDCFEELSPRVIMVNWEELDKIKRRLSK